MFTSSSWPSLKTTCEKSFKDFVEIYKGLPTYLIVYFPHYRSIQKQKQNIKQNKLNTIPSRKSNRGVSNDFTSHLLWLARCAGAGVSTGILFLLWRKLGVDSTRSN